MLASQSSMGLMGEVHKQYFILHLMGEGHDALLSCIVQYRCLCTYIHYVQKEAG